MSETHTLDKAFDPKAIETTRYQQWEQAGYFTTQLHTEAAPYCIMLPPPNVTGSLHMGHAFQQTLMDLLTRYHRMKGDNTLWQVGTDHAGIATQMVVEQQLAAENKTRHTLGRENFIERVWEWKDTSGGWIMQQMRRLGTSPDWSRERFTLDPHISDAVTKVFIQLHEEGLIYRGKRLVNWDPVLHTAISDLEVTTEEESGSLWHLRYPLTDGSGHVVVATTRPETLLGDAAIAVNPEDERFKDLVGKTVALPLTDRAIPIIADEYVDPAFGTGCVKITPAHDFNDADVGKRHELPILNIFTPDACLNDDVPAAYRGLDRFEARKKIIKDLEKQQLVEKIEDHTRPVPRGDRSGAIIEPYLTDQWYVKIAPLAQPAVDAVKNGDITFVPKNWEKTYFEWMHNIEDWCISRQIWWGHRIPAWYDEEGTVYVGESESAVREKHNLADDITLTQDSDVLDTWFSSALWPFSTLGWPEKTPELNHFYPGNVLITGFDIIFFWVARMIMMGLKFTGEVPFKEVYITGLIRDAKGQKMSKSKGNVIDPIDLIDGITLEDLVKKRTAHLMQASKVNEIEATTRKDFPEGISAFGTDALRFYLCAVATAAREIRLDFARIEGYRHFCNKLWNAARYVLMNTENYTPGAAPTALSLADHYIQSRLQTLIADIHKHFTQYRFDLAAQALYEFTWNEYCDWYLELCKPVLNGDDEALKYGTQTTLLQVLETLLRLIHPIMPFITDTIWQQIAPRAGKPGKSIMEHAFPDVDNALCSPSAEAQIAWLKQVIIGVRNIRGEMNISPNKTLSILVKNATAQDKDYFARNESFIKQLAKIDAITWLTEKDEAPPAATALAGEMEMLIPMAGLIDKKAESARLDKALTKLTKELTRAQSQLNNPNYLAKAPKEVVEKLRQHHDETAASVEKLQKQLAELAAL